MEVTTLPFDEPDADPEKNTAFLAVADRGSRIRRTEPARQSVKFFFRKRALTRTGRV